jgi:hypothetical protein
MGSRLRVYVMHAGWPLLDDLLALLWAHRQVYVEVGAIVWALPEPEFYRYLQRIVEAGFGNRVMFGSDQMVWPGVIEPSIQRIERAPFLFLSRLPRFPASWFRRDGHRRVSHLAGVDERGRCRHRHGICGVGDRQLLPFCSASAPPRTPGRRRRRPASG